MLRFTKLFTVLVIIIFTALTVNIGYCDSSSTGAFQDVPPHNHAYSEMESLQKNNLLVGYSKTAFNGKPLLSRYMFGVALHGALDRLPLPAEISDGSKSVTTDELSTLKLLIEQFGPELEMLGDNTSEALANIRELGKAEAEWNSNAASRNFGIKLVSLSPFDDTMNAIQLETSQPSVPTPTRNARMAPAIPSNLSSYALVPSYLSPDQEALEMTLPFGDSGHLALSLSHSSLYMGNSLDGVTNLEYGTAISINPIGHLNVGAGAKQSIVSNSILGAQGSNSNVYQVHVAYVSGGSKATVGYQVISSLSAPGTLNSTQQLQGPYTRLMLHLGNLRSYLGGDLFLANSNQDSITPGNIYRGEAGLEWKLSSSLSLSANYQLYDYSMSALGHTPLDQYLTLGAGVNITRNASLSLAYELSPGSLQSSSLAPQGNSSVFTTQLSVHF